MVWHVGYLLKACDLAEHVLADVGVVVRPDEVVKRPDVTQRAVLLAFAVDHQQSADGVSVDVERAGVAVPVPSINTRLIGSASPASRTSG